jgi:outer membrane protein OmpA-like peptidoglycan-associated protein
MSVCRYPRGKKTFWLCFFLTLCSVLSANVVLAQDQQNPPKVDLFAGYQWLNPGGNIPGGPNGSGGVLPLKLPSMPDGFGLALGYNFHPNFALEGDFGANYKSGNDFSTYSLGPRATYRGEGINLFVHTLLSANHLNTSSFGARTGVGAILGGGIDLNIIKHLSIRLIEADYQWARHNFAAQVSPSQPDLRRPSFDGARLRTGVVLNFGGAPPIAPTASCSVDHAEVMQGEPVTATATASNFNPKHTLSYAWSGNGGPVTGKDGTASIDTKGVAGGNYTVTSHITDPKVKKNGEASCTANYAVKEPPKNPPTMSCSASPTSGQAGTPVTVTCSCTSPDGVPVTVSGWSSSGGSVSGNGNVATLTTTGASPGAITVNATCTDSRGLATNASSQAMVEAPPPPVVDKQLEARLALHSVYFPTAQPTVKDPNAGLVPSQEQTLLTLATDFKKYLEAKPDAHLTLEGHADVRGSVPYNQALSERRVARVKNYLVSNGVPEANIETKALGDQHNLTAAEVKASVDENQDLTKEERARVLRNMKTIIWASNRRVDITLNTGSQTQTSVRHYPFNATDSLTLIGGREAAKKATPAKKVTKKPAKKK